MMLQLQTEKDTMFLVTDTFIYAYDAKMGYIDIDSYLDPFLIYAFILQTLTFVWSRLYEGIFPHIQSDIIFVWMNTSTVFIIWLIYIVITLSDVP